MKYNRNAVIFTLQEKVTRIKKGIEEDFEYQESQHASVVEDQQQAVKEFERMLKGIAELQGVPTIVAAQTLAELSAGYSSPISKVTGRVTQRIPSPQRKENVLMAELLLVIDLLRVSPDEYVATRELQQLGVYSYVKVNKK